MHGILRLREKVQDDPDEGWRERYDARRHRGGPAASDRSRDRRGAACRTEGTRPVPDATGLELIAQELREADAGHGPRHGLLPRARRRS